MAEGGRECCNRRTRPTSSVSVESEQAAPFRHGLDAHSSTSTSQTPLPAASQTPATQISLSPRELETAVHAVLPFPDCAAQRAASVGSLAAVPSQPLELALRWQVPRP
jgi:hypothetical protein